LGSSTDNHLFIFRLLVSDTTSWKTVLIVVSVDKQQSVSFHVVFFNRGEWYALVYSVWIPIGEALLAIIVIANFTLATFMDPGVIPKGTRFIKEY